MHFLVCCFYYKELNLKGIYKACINSVKSTATVMFIVATASAVGYLITIAQIPVIAVQLFSGFIDKPVLLLVIINLFLFLMGMVMDVTPNISYFCTSTFPSNSGGWY